MPPPSQMPLVCWQRRLIIQSRLWISKSIHRTSDLSESSAPAYSCYLCIGFFILFSKKTLYNILILRKEPWQLNDRPNGIWFCDDMSETTPLKKRLGTTFGEKRQNGLRFMGSHPQMTGQSPKPSRRAHWHLCTEYPWKCHSGLRTFKRCVTRKKIK